jgi:endonuclease/exonuclease/phosphatase family metal-dependent hydrolase
MAQTACKNPRTYAGGASSLCKCPFSILTFNVYPGPPIPYTAPDLFPHRIAAQITAIRELDPDIVCFQELYCDKSFAALRAAFPDYDVHRDRGRQNELGEEVEHPRRRRSNASLVGLVVVGALFVAVCWYAWRPTAALLPLAAAASLWCGAYLVLPRNSGLLAWMRNRGTGLGIMVRRTRAHVIEHRVERFRCQKGDPLNLVAPRGFTRTMIALNSACECGPAPAFVFNTHLNALGSEKHRVAQAEQLASEILRVSSAARLVLCGDFNETPTMCSGVRQCLEGDGYGQADLMLADPVHRPTYCPQQNPLARGSYAPQCLDQIYFKPGANEGLVPTDSARVVFNKAPYISDHYGVLAKFH